MNQKDITIGSKRIQRIIYLGIRNGEINLLNKCKNFKTAQYPQSNNQLNPNEIQFAFHGPKSFALL